MIFKLSSYLSYYNIFMGKLQMGKWALSSDESQFCAASWCHHWGLYKFLLQVCREDKLHYLHQSLCVYRQQIDSLNSYKCRVQWNKIIEILLQAINSTFYFQYYIKRKAEKNFQIIIYSYVNKIILLKIEKYFWLRSIFQK